MPSFAPTYFATWTGGQWTSKPGTPLNGFTQDTRLLKAGQVFVALQTEKRDGHDFLSAAAAAGASAAIVSRVNQTLDIPQLVVADPLRAFQAIAREHRRSFRGSVIGVSGSCGKTSTKNLLAKLLGGDPLVLATEGNLNNFLGVPLTLTRLEPGTHEVAVVEAGINQVGEMAELATIIEPDYGIITLIAPAHTAQLGGLDGVAREKATLLQHVRPAGLGVFPKQCWDFAAFQDLPQTSIVVAPEGEKVQAPRVATFGVRSSPSATEIMIGRRRFVLRRVTRGMAQNAVLAIILASELGTTDDAIQRALEDWRPAKWRGEFRQDGARTMYLDFYNANPASMADALETFQAMVPADAPRLLVLGCMEELGPDSPRYHRELGRSLRLRPQDHAFVIGTEASSILAGAMEAGFAAEQVEVVETLAPVTAKIAEFRGAIFMKGSRRYELERALPVMPESSSGGGQPPSGGRGTSHSFSSYRPETVSPFSWYFPRPATRSIPATAHPFL